MPASAQQRWIWNGIARGAKAVVFWCWRDEVFGCESGGFGLAGHDGLADERIEQLKHTHNVLKEHDTLLSGYAPDRPQVAILFEQANHMLDWAENGDANTAVSGLLGYLTALQRLNIPCQIIDSHHLGDLENVKLVFMPWSLVVRPETADRLVAFVEAGGTLFCEAETGAFTEQGFYASSGRDRAFMHRLGIRDHGRRVRAISSITIDMHPNPLAICVDGWLTPLSADDSDILARQPYVGYLFLRRFLGKGRVYVLGSFAGSAYRRRRYNDFESLITHLAAEADVMPSITVNSDIPGQMLQWRYGTSGDTRLLFLLNAGPARAVPVQLANGLSDVPATGCELYSGERFPISKQTGNCRFDLSISEGGLAVCTF